MSKIKLYGLVTAFAALVIAIAAKLTGGAPVMLALITVASTALLVIDIIAYRQDKKNGGASAVGLARIIALVITELILAVACVITFIL